MVASSESNEDENDPISRRKGQGSVAEAHYLLGLMPSVNDSEEFVSDGHTHRLHTPVCLTMLIISLRCVGVHPTSGFAIDVLVTADLATVSQALLSSFAPGRLLPALIYCSGSMAGTGDW